jgi:predicted TPR repeat methyltransferase
MMSRVEKPSANNMNAALHDAYAAEYDSQIKTYSCYITDVLFGLLFEFTHPGQVLLDAGIGSGLSAQLFARTGLEIHGMDFSQSMLSICQKKAFTTSLILHDIEVTPWPYPSGRFDHVICCGVMHFLTGLEGIFIEAGRVLKPGGWFAFTTRVPPHSTDDPQPYDRGVVDGFNIFSHTPVYIQTMFLQNEMTRVKQQKCFVGQELFDIWIVQKK